ncbi:tRNA uridine-5-carboxymethylaminomethyl(34) synthesis GTPase MnmE [bacterium]|nr:tRNA uridine-5-carboxymethylaminomethyl(34) synthesis GTPase MnmE [bacterium]
MSRENGSGTHETIAAISTPPGEGGIAVVRLSGPRAVEIAASLFQGMNPLTEAKPRTACHGWLVQNGTCLDEAVVTVFPGPRSYTGEDVVEISSHGGTWVTRRILDALVAAGAEPAAAGEFTRRAFLNGRLDLAQAEAVADLIRAKTEASRRVAMAHLRGRLTEQLDHIRERLLGICAHLELELDFSEEDVEFTSREEVSGSLAAAVSEIETLIRSYARGRVCREGFNLTIVGRTNVGKSSLLNALIERERAIVTDIPGTTRDTIEDVLDMDGICFTITDTAGIRETSDPVEREGVRRTRIAIEDADMVVVVFDGSTPLTPEDSAVVDVVNGSGKPVLAVVNKSDLKQNIELPLLKQRLPAGETVFVSAKSQAGIPGLIARLEEAALQGGIPESGEVVITHARHHAALERARSSFLSAGDTLKSGLSQEFVALDLRAGLDALAEITGAVTSDDVLNHIFNEFCIGK